MGVMGVWSVEVFVELCACQVGGGAFRGYVGDGGMEWGSMRV